MEKIENGLHWLDYWLQVLGDRDARSQRNYSSTHTEIEKQQQSTDTRGQGWCSFQILCILFQWDHELKQIGVLGTQNSSLLPKRKQGYDYRENMLCLRPQFKDMQIWKISLRYFHEVFFADGEWWISNDCGSQRTLISDCASQLIVTNTKRWTTIQ